MLLMLKMQIPFLENFPDFLLRDVIWSITYSLTEKVSIFEINSFSSSSYKQWFKTFKNIGSYIKIFESLHPNHNINEE